ncbi:MAG: methyltransferase domain-containing protein [Chloroflexaceae bacterium]|nr:methyltransferase domain-containing protein [Chloroflexaceae bacterium]
MGLHLAPGATTNADGIVEHGTLTCATCTTRYPIRNGIADLLGPLALPTTPAQLTNYLPPTAWLYERTWRPQALSLLSGEPFGYSRELPLIARLMEPERPGIYLDVACSNGLYARALAQARGGAPGHVVGIDHALPMVQEGRRFAQQAGLRISFVRASAQALPFAAGSVAGVAMGGSLNEIGDVNKALAEMRRVLAPDGRAVLMNLVQARTKGGRGLQRVLGFGGVAFWPMGMLNQHFADNDLRLAAQWRYGVVVFSLLLPG